MSEATLLKGLVQHIREMHHISPSKMGRNADSEIYEIEYNSCHFTFLESGLMVTPRVTNTRYSAISVESATHNRIIYQYSNPTLIPTIEKLLITPGKNSPTNVSDMRKVIGDKRYLIMGDPHGCLDEVRELLRMVGFNPEEDYLLTVGDLIDRGPMSRATVEFFMSLPNFHTVRGNHDHKLCRLLSGNNVKISGSLQKTLDDFGGADNMNHLCEFFGRMPLIIQVPAGYIVHAGFTPTHGDIKASRRQTTDDCLYIRYFGGGNHFDDENGAYWSTKWDWKLDGIRRPAVTNLKIFHGHEPHSGDEPFIANGCINLDGGCAFGGFLRVWDSATGEVTSLKSPGYSDAGRVCWIEDNKEKSDD
jgi:hypothetical protein